MMPRVRNQNLAANRPQVSELSATTDPQDSHEKSHKKQRTHFASRFLPDLDGRVVQRFLRQDRDSSCPCSERQLCIAIQVYVCVVLATRVHTFVTSENGVQGVVRCCTWEEWDIERW